MIGFFFGGMGLSTASIGEGVSIRDVFGGFDQCYEFGYLFFIRRKGATSKVPAY